MANTPSNYNMGIGALGSPGLVFKRKFRWTFAVQPNCSSATAIPESFVKLAARPQLSIEETEINFLNSKTFIPGKGVWETITVTYIDVAGTANTAGSATTSAPNAGLWSWLASVYDFTNPTTLKQGSTYNDFTATGTLILWDGCGNAIEQWTLNQMWPSNVNFGDLDMSSSDTVDIELTLRYSGVQYQNYCPGFNIQGCCNGCA